MLKKIYNQEKGQLAPFFTFAVIILLILAVFTVNIGRIGFHRVRTSVAADTGAITGGSYEDLALNVLSATSVKIYQTYVISMAIFGIPFFVNCWWSMCHCGTCPADENCIEQIARGKLKKWLELAGFILLQWTSIIAADDAAHLGFKMARAQARMMAYGNAGVDDLQKFDEYAGVSFSKSDPDAVLSPANDQYFIYRDAWLTKGNNGSEPNYTHETFQKAESRFGLWLTLWQERETDDEEAGGDGDDNRFNRTGPVTFEWPYPTKSAKNSLTVDVQGDDFSELQTSAGDWSSLLAGVSWACFDVPIPLDGCICIPIPIPVYIPLDFLGLDMMIITGINNFDNGTLEPLLTVTTIRTEPESQDMVFWKSKYPVVTSKATAKVSGGSIKGSFEGDANYKPALVSTE